MIKQLFSSLTKAKMILTESNDIKPALLEEEMVEYLHTILVFIYYSNINKYNYHTFCYDLNRWRFNQVVESKSEIVIGN